MKPARRLRRTLAGACFIGAVAAGIDTLVEEPTHRWLVTSPSWKHGGLEQVTIRSLLGQPLRVRRGDTLRTFETKRGTTLMLTGDDLRPGPRR